MEGQKETVGNHGAKPAKTSPGQATKTSPGQCRKGSPKHASKHASKPKPKNLAKGVGELVGYIHAPGPGNREYRLSVEFAEGGQLKQQRRIQDTLEILYRKGKINHEQYNAGKHFQNDFTIAHLDNLKAVDIDHVSTGGEPNWDRIEMSQRNVSRVMDYLGGMGSPGGRVLWHVIGLGESLEYFTRSRNVVDFMFAQGLLSAVLGMMGRRYPIHSSEEFK